jgi:hypothetical protein
MDPLTVPLKATPPWVDAALKEYDAQRTAAIEGYKAGQQTLTFGATTVGILVAGALNVWTEALPATLLFLGVIPLVSAVVLVQWVGQMLALRQVDQYLQKVEEAIRYAYPSLPETLFTWESTFPDRKRIGAKSWMAPDLRWHENAAITAFSLLALGSLVIGGYKGFAGHPVIVTVVGVLEGVALTLVGILLLSELGGAAKHEPESATWLTSSRDPNNDDARSASR